MLVVAQGEIEELRDSLRYAEYMLARTKEEKEAIDAELAQHDQQMD